MRKAVFFIVLAAGLAAQAPRDGWQKPAEVVEALAIQPDQVVADIGAGAGYFARRFAPLAAKVYAVEVDAKLLEWAGKGAPPNLAPVVAAADDPNLPPESVDLIFFCNVLHHIHNRAAYYPKLARALKPGGRIAILEFYKKPLPVGPREDHKMSEEEVMAELEAAGFRRIRNFDFLPYQYFFVFERR